MVEHICYKKWGTSQYQLREEISELISITKGLLFTFFENDVQAIYFKGSAQKKWDSPIDYVPGISDVDLHVSFFKPEKYDEFASDINQVNTFSKELEKSLHSAKKTRLHLPKLQLLAIHALNKVGKGYFPPVAATLETVFGSDYPQPFSKKIHGRIDLFAEAQKSILGHQKSYDKIVSRLLDRYNDYLLKIVHEVTWRLSSAGPNFLVLKNIDFEEAWTLNRTKLVEEFEKLGYDTLAENYKNFYLYMHDYYYTKESSDLRAAILAVYEALGIILREAKKC